MRYTDFKAAIHHHLRQCSAGRTWLELREALALPYERPCPEWTRRLEAEIGLTRLKGSGRQLVWSLKPSGRSASSPTAKRESASV